MPIPLSDRQLFELELEQLKTIELLENEEMWAQRVIDEAASRSAKNAELGWSNDSSEMRKLEQPATTKRHPIAKIL